MPKPNSKNERIKRRYLIYLEDAKRMSPATIDSVAASISLFEVSTRRTDFAAFHIEQARKFKRDQQQAINETTGNPLAIATVRSRVLALREFFRWLAGQQGYKSKLTYSDAEYFNISANDDRIATARRPKQIATFEQIRSVIAAIPADGELHRRDRALIALATLTGARAAALASLQIRNLEVTKRRVLQDARNVHTKFRKTFTTYFFPVGEDFEAIVHDWVDYLTKEKLFGPTDPLFPKTEVQLDASGRFAPVGISREPWRGTQAIRNIYKRAFNAAGLDYSNPHTFRDTLSLHASKNCRTPEEIKAWSQNLGHDSVMTTLLNYGTVPDYRQAEILASLGEETQAPLGAEVPDQETINRVLEHLTQSQRR